MAAPWLRMPLVLSFLLLAGSIPLAQTQFASLTGRITSTGGDPLPDAEVVATNVATGVSQSAKSNQDGFYTLSALPIGTYRVRATAERFQSSVTTPIRLESGQNARIDLTMQMGFADTIEVTGITPILQTQDAVVGEVLSEATIQHMPLNGRNFSQLSLLLPGVSTPDPNSFTEPKNLNLSGGRPYVNGQREQDNNYMLDGVDMNDAIENRLPYQPSPDALAEVRVDTNNYSAEFGNVAGAVIGSTIKSGTNDFHGNTFEYWRGGRMAANSWDNNRVHAEKAQLQQHVFGATLGGPIVRGKMFFFGDYEGFIRNRPFDAITTVAPEPWRRGDFSALRDSAGQLVVITDPVTGEQFPGNRIESGRFSPIANALLSNPTLYPPPNRSGDVNNLVTPSSDRARTHQGDVKIDANLTDEERIFGRISYQSFRSAPERAALESSLTSKNNAPFLGFAGSWIRMPRSSLMNELLVGFTDVKFQTIAEDWAGIGNANALIGIPGGQPIAGLSRLAIGAYGAGDNGASWFTHTKTVQVAEKFSLFRGRHQAKLGGRWLYRRERFAPSGNYGALGEFDYFGAFTGFAFSDFLLDAVGAKGVSGQVPPFTHLTHHIGIFAQDDVRLGDGLTLNLGLSWEYFSPWVEKDNRQSNIDLQTGQLLLAGQDGNSRALYDAFYGGWEPRLGAAWSPSEKWVVRSGFGVVQYMEGTGWNLRLTYNPPFSFEGQKTFTGAPGSASVGFADITSNVNGGPGTLYRIFARNVRPQLTKQWNVFVERKLTDRLSAQVGYVGSRSSHVVVPFDFNQPQPDPGPVETWRPLDERRPLHALNPAIGMTSGTQSIGVGAYDALQASARQRLSDGLEFLASYTYGKALSDSVGYYGVGWGQTSGQGFYYLDSDHPGRNYGPPPYDVRHNFSLSAVYQLPFGEQRKFGQNWNRALKAVLGGWSVNTIFQAHTGLALTVIDFADQSLQTPHHATMNFPNRACNGAIPGAGVDDAWIDVACFPRAPVGQLGDAGAGILYGPGYWNWDLALDKDVHINAKRYLTVKIEAFNVLNHPNFALQAGSADISSPTTFGRIQNTFSTPRIIELALRFTY
jgi:Carboxypeptidase regulatory-like domain